MPNVILPKWCIQVEGAGGTWTSPPPQEFHEEVPIPQKKEGENDKKNVTYFLDFRHSYDLFTQILIRRTDG